MLVNFVSVSCAFQKIGASILYDFVTSVSVHTVVFLIFEISSFSCDSRWWALIFEYFGCIMQLYLVLVAVGVQLKMQRTVH